MAAAPPSNDAAAASAAAASAEKEAFQYWGYLLKPDRTGTDKLKKLLQGLHKITSTSFEPSDSPDLTPSQLAHFYRALNGNYDQLFLSTPPATIAFIYKNLGCLHSLQPAGSDRYSGSAPYSDPTVPALKVEGWIMWQTIQLLLGPDEHSEFLRHAVQKWDVKDPSTGETFPKILPRQCFPPAPDTHMNAWYEGVSERLRREAEEEQAMRIKGSGDTRNHNGRLDRRRSYPSDEDEAEDEESESDNNRGSALAYFRNPLFRTVDGRPGVVRRASKRPAASPRLGAAGGSFVQKSRIAASTAASTAAGVMRNVASPHLWDGQPRHKHDDAHHRRKGVTDKYKDEEHGSRRSSPHGPLYQDKHRRRGSHQFDSPASDRSDWPGGTDAGPRRSASQRVSHRDQLARDNIVRHRRSHEPHASPKEYFPSEDEYSWYRRNSAHTTGSPGVQSPQPTPGFVPSGSPLFATHVARGDTAPQYRAQSQSRPPLRRRADYRSPERDGSRVRSSRPHSGTEREWDGSDVSAGSARAGGTADSYRASKLGGGGGGGGSVRKARFDMGPPPSTSAGGMSGRMYAGPSGAMRG